MSTSTAAGQAAVRPRRRPRSARSRRVITPSTGCEASVSGSMRVTSSEEGSAPAIMVIDSPGGELTSMDRIVKAILAAAEGAPA